MNHYTHEQISPHCYLITEDYGEGARYTIGLVVGNTCVAVIDSGWGVTGNLREYISGITSLPACCLLTHPHPDHVGASVQFDKIYMNPVDEQIAISSVKKEKRLGDLLHRFGGTLLGDEMSAEVTDCSDFRPSPISGGDLIDLGDISLKVYPLPGHTPGSLAFYCPEDKIAYVGDAIGKRVNLLDPKADIGAYLCCLKAFDADLSEETVLINGHNQSPIPRAIISEILSACSTILAGNGSCQPAEVAPFMRVGLHDARILSETFGSAEVVYTAL